MAVKFKSVLFITFIFMALSGCASPEQRAANQRQQQWQVQQAEQARVGALMRKCDSYGFRRGTTEFAQCLQNAEQQKALEDAIYQQQNPPINWFKASSCFSTGRLDCIP
jgi:hypothetical protein